MENLKRSTVGLSQVALFVCGVALSWWTLPEVSLHALRAPATTTSCPCSVDLTNLTLIYNLPLGGALGGGTWNPLDGTECTLQFTGNYDTTVNTPSKDITEELSLFFKVRIELDGKNVVGTAYGTWDFESFPGLVGTDNCENSLTENFIYHMGVDDEDAFENAALEAAQAIANANGGGEIGNIFTFPNSFEKAFSFRVEITLTGELNGTKCRDTIHGDGTESFKKGALIGPGKVKFIPN